MGKSNEIKDCCANWAVQIEKINGPIINQTNRWGGEYKYDGIPFRYCPWCGKLLNTVATDKDIEHYKNIGI